LNEKDLFPNYEPKKTPNTVYDYLKISDSFVFKTIEKIGKTNLSKLKNIIEYFKNTRMQLIKIQEVIKKEI
jgi:hypothetical protein